VTELTLQETAKRVTEKTGAYASVYGFLPTQAELDCLFRLQKPSLWRAWLLKPPDDQTPLLRCWLGAMKRLRGGGKPPDADPVLLALRALAKIEEIAASTAAAIVALSTQTQENEAAVSHAQ